jgi:1-deoxy-D-xylulose-5-phosphate synthase
LATIRQLDGLSGFLSREESEYDVFGAGHAGTSISAALGMVEANSLEGPPRKVVAVISDGGLSAGLTFEGLNQAGHLDKDLIVVLNDNAIFIDPRVGAVSSFLSKQFTTDFGVRIQKHLSSWLLSLPRGENLKQAARKLKDSFLGLVTPGFLFESLGYIRWSHRWSQHRRNGYDLPERQENRRSDLGARADDKGKATRRRRTIR